MQLFFDTDMIDIGSPNQNEMYEVSRENMANYSKLVALANIRPPKRVSVGDHRRAYMELGPARVIDSERIEVKVTLRWLEPVVVRPGVG